MSALRKTLAAELAAHESTPERTLYGCAWCPHWCWLLPAETEQPLPVHSWGGADCMGSGSQPVPRDVT